MSGRFEFRDRPENVPAAVALQTVTVTRMAGLQLDPGLLNAPVTMAGQEILYDRVVTAVAAVLPARIDVTEPTARLGDFAGANRAPLELHLTHQAGLFFTGTAYAPRIGSWHVRRFDALEQHPVDLTDANELRPDIATAVSWAGLVKLRRLLGPTLATQVSAAGRAALGPEFLVPDHVGELWISRYQRPALQRLAVLVADLTDTERDVADALAASGFAGEPRELLDVARRVAS